MKFYFKYIFLFLFCSGVVILGSKFKYILGGDIEAFFLYPGVFFAKAWYSWQDSNGSGAYTFVNQGALITYGVFYYLRYVFNVKILNWTIYTLSLFLSFVFVEKLSKYILRILKQSANAYVPFLVSFFYVFNIYFFFLFFRGIHTEVFAYFLIPANLLFFLKYLHEKQSIYILGSVSSLLLAQNFGHLFIFSVTVFITFLWYTLFVSLPSNRTQSFLRMLKYFLVMFLLHAIWFVPTIFYYLDQAQNLQQNPYIMETTVSVSFAEQIKNNSYTNSFRGLYGSLIGAKNFFPIPEQHSIAALFLFLDFFLILLFLVSKTSLSNSKGYSFWFLVLVCSLVFNLGAYGHMSSFYVYVVEHVPLMMIFRAVDSKMNYLILISLAFLLTYVFAWLFQEKRLSKMQSGLYIFLVLACVYPVSGFLSKPFNHEYTTVNIPGAYIKSIEEFNALANNSDLKKGIILPRTGYQWASFTTWGFWGYSFFQQSNANIGYFDVGNTAFSKNDYKFYLDNISSLKNLEDINLDNLSEYGVDFLVIQKDFNYNFTPYYTFKNQDIEIEKMVDKNVDKLNVVLENDFFNVYKINVNKNSSSETSAELLKINPTKYLIILNNLDSEKVIRLNKSFHKYWVVFPVKEFSWWKAPFLKPMADRNHYVEYGYANAWNLSQEDLDRAKDENGEVKLVLYFLPQTYFYYGIVVSITTMLILVGYLIFGFIRNRKTKVV